MIIDNISSICQPYSEESAVPNSRGSESLLCPLVTLEEDDVWKWNSLSEIVDTINKSLYWQATLLTKDGPAVRLALQKNGARQMPYECVVSEVGLFGLTEPSLSAIAATPSGGLAYQVREFFQAIVEPAKRWSSPRR